MLVRAARAGGDPQLLSRFIRLVSFVMCTRLCAACILCVIADGTSGGNRNEMLTALISQLRLHELRELPVSCGFLSPRTVLRE